MADAIDTKSRILVVDDDKNITGLTQIILETAGYDCHVVNSGRDCIKLLQDSKKDYNESRFDLILLDVAMPGFSGMDVVAKLKEERLFPLGRVVFFTASSASSLDDAELKKLGVRDCFKKPFKKSDLLNALQRYVAS
jgi:CheY-like chemotaxis protein